MKTQQQATLQHLSGLLDNRYMQMNGELCDAIDVLEHLLDAMADDDPVSGHSDQVQVALNMLIAASNEGAKLQNTVGDILQRLLARNQLAKSAFAQGWEDRLLDLLGRATPEQAAVLRSLISQQLADSDDGISF
jgi:hypothetical protein